ncbi:MAG TPA: hypothetical protein ENH62_17115 [Marinobacter sp.]|nr:hypothetical protein [Marinobacter sp.]
MMGHYLIHVDPSVLMKAMGLDDRVFMHDLKLARWTGGVIEVLVMHPTFAVESDPQDLPEQLTLDELGERHPEVFVVAEAEAG